MGTRTRSASRTPGARVRAGAVQIDGSTCRFGAGAGNTPCEALVAVCDRLDPTGIDVFALFDAAEDSVRPVMDGECVLDRMSLVMGYAGVYSSFLEACVPSGRTVWGLRGRDPGAVKERKLVGGQEDQLHRDRSGARRRGTRR